LIDVGYSKHFRVNHSADEFVNGDSNINENDKFPLECQTPSAKVQRRVGKYFLFASERVHIVAYAKALEVLTGVNLKPMFPIPDLDNSKFPEAKKLEDEDLHRIMFRWSPKDFTEIGQIWKGEHPIDGSQLIVADEDMPEGFDPPDLDEEPQLNAPGVEPEFLAEVAKRLFG